MDDTIDLELLDLINKLSRIQKDIGAKAKDEVAVKGADGNIDKFLDLRAQIIHRISDLRETLETVQKLNSSPGLNPKDLISAQSKVRTELTTLHEEWKELDTLYRNEAKKKRSKLSPEEMSGRQQMIAMLQVEIQAIRDIQRAGYVKGYQSVAMATLEESELFKPKDIESQTAVNNGSSATASRGVNHVHKEDMTDNHRFALQKIKERDLEIDEHIMDIGKGVDELGEIARQARDEVKLQNKMLDTLKVRVDDVHEHVVNINVRMKEVLEETRRSDKLCVDIFCCMIFIGMIIVLVEISKQPSK